MKIKLAKFLFGFALVVFGLAIGSGSDYWDMRQLEARLDKTISSTSVTDPAVIRQFLKSHDVSPDLSDAIMLQFSGADFYYKAQLQNIRVSVSQKKLQALKSMKLSLMQAMFASLLSYSVIRKSQATLV